MTNLYTINKQYPAPIPNRIRMPNGFTRTDSSTFTEAEIADAGYVLAPEPPPVEYPNRLAWDGDSWVTRPPNETEIAEQTRIIEDIRSSKLLEVDEYIANRVSAGESVPEAVIQYRKEVISMDNIWFPMWPEVPQELA